MLAAAIVGAAWLLPTPARARTRVIVPVQSGGYAQVWELARLVEQKAQMPGFAAFALAVATSESRGNAAAVNDSPNEAARACTLYERNRTTRYKNNPYPAERFCFGSGGFYGFMPATALAGKPFRNLDPYLVFDPAASTAFLADFVRRVINGYWDQIPASCRTWTTVRRFMAGNKVGLDCNETKFDRSARVRDKFRKNLVERGVSTNVMDQIVVVGNWPGGMELYQFLGGFEGQAPIVLEEDIPL